MYFWVPQKILPALAEFTTILACAGLKTSVEDGAKIESQWAAEVLKISRDPSTDSGSQVLLECFPV